jgi:hypothetical protein
MVGWMLRLRRTTCWPVWFRLSLLPRLSDVRTALSLLVAPSSEPTPRSVESAAALVLEPREPLGVGDGLALQHD